MKTTANQTDMTDSFCALLQVPANPDASKRHRMLNNRLAGLDLANTCNRCGGCGQYSFCAMYGSTCFGCGGSGMVAPKLTAALYRKAEALVESGKLAEYLTDLRAKTEAKRAADRAVNGVMTAWRASGVSEAYNWHKAAQGVPYDEEISDTVNAPMCELFDAVNKAAQLCDRNTFTYRLRSVKTAEERKALDAEFATMRFELAKQAEAAVAQIQELAKLIPAIQEKHNAKA